MGLIFQGYPIAGAKSVKGDSWRKSQRINAESWSSSAGQKHLFLAPAGYPHHTQLCVFT
jgi:hypothetical protein